MSPTERQALVWTNLILSFIVGMFIGIIIALINNNAHLQQQIIQLKFGPKTKFNLNPPTLNQEQTI